MTGDLFEGLPDENPREIVLAPGAMLLRGFASAQEAGLLAAIDAVCAQAPLRHMVTPGGHTMSVAMTSCGEAGWVSDRSGYRYAACDPDSGQPWPPMPDIFKELARRAAAQAGFDNFMPDACLINCYAPAARMSLHQDKDERDAAAPIVSVSLGLPAVFLFGGLQRSDRVQRYRLEHGDVVVWGGPARFAYHGIAPLAAGVHRLVDAWRFNLTFRKTV